jgi:ABC-type sugar transport system substrate-binding protein
VLQPLYTAVVSSIVEPDAKNAIKKGEAPRPTLAATALQSSQTQGWFSSQLLYRAVTTAEIMQRESGRLNCVHDYHGVCGHDCTTQVKVLRNLR